MDREDPLWESVTRVEAAPAFVSMACRALWSSVNERLAARVGDVLDVRLPVPETGDPRTLWLLRRLSVPAATDQQDMAARAADCLREHARNGSADGGSVPPLCSDSPEWLADVLPAVLGELAEAGLSPRVALGSPTTALARSWTAGHELLRRVWPEGWQEMTTVLTVGVLLDGPHFSSGSAATTFGAIYANPRSLRTPQDVMQILVHESAHHVLWLKENLRPFLLNPDDKANSPLRQDERLLRGVFHAAFVLARLALTADALIQRIGDDGPLTEPLPDLVQKLGEALATLEARARFTSEGRALCDDMQAIHERTR
ncbi:HEXXH motif-containing protein [Nonomuraea thailandensis]|uniref:HEXXH motif-containing protein n=1 Tax=Nonomuraea thailandensis TaxID=1188745 RepID=A0A9X2K2P1_9ACTN|nr:HEXXH motif-containing putative peptide modification protein [Nonomuraea thailandensis]MCP2358223.1 HEXXH motif-containing protein [Nonomuraea thailandensis]